MFGAAKQTRFTDMVRSARPKEDSGNFEAVSRRAETEGVRQSRLITSKPVLG